MSMISEIKMHGQEFVQLENSKFELLMSLYGAQILAIQPKDGSPDWLWLGDQSPLVEGKAIRGGIPLCWPIFGVDPEGKLPKHGFARLQKWHFKGDAEDEIHQAVAVSFGLKESAFSRQYWPYDFSLEFAVRLTLEGLECEWQVTNTDVRAFSYTQAMHPYFHISALKNISIKGLDGRVYIRDGDSHAYTWQEGESLDMARDDAFINVDGDITMFDSVWQRSLGMKRVGAPDAVVWNPHIEGAKNLDDMADNGYDNMLCLEPAQLEPITLQPNESAIMRMVLELH